MKNNRAEAKIILDTRTIKKDDTYPVKLKVTLIVENLEMVFLQLPLNQV